MAEPAANSIPARVEVLVRAMQRAGLTIYGIDVQRSGVRILTQPAKPDEIAPEAAVEDDVARWLRENP